ncbi:MAG: response regulator [Candidatus Nanopelagicales bacterium]|nr:response regulator [Candidatus Nanopelagicales bacterium]MCF8539345.1 response regulator [Candidatus Nanopelagicales bacterium]MCF8551504.1 response regulator [Candidatus Nanopelagicales bacterium]
MNDQSEKHSARNSHSRSVLVVEDDSFLRELIALALERHGFIVETAATAADARRVFSRGDHDSVVLDVSLGSGPNGFDLADALREVAPHVAIVFLTNLPDSRFSGRSPRHLPKGVTYLRKSNLDDINTLVVALDSALRGHGTESFREDRDPARPFGQLTQKQMDVLKLAAEGMSNAQIAHNRGVSVKAVEDTLARAAQALSIDSNQEGNIRVAAVRRFLAVTKGESPRSSSNFTG